MPSDTYTVALVGNPNSGKTTLFNALTGSRQRVGNYPGVTVEAKSGVLRCGDDTLNFVDLPGTYSLTAYTAEELIARDFVLRQRPDVVVDVIDSSNLERNLYLAVQLMEMGAPLVLALNMTDLAERRGVRIDVQALSRRLGVPVVPIVASRGKGLEKLVAAVLDVARSRRAWTPLTIDYADDLGRHVDEIAALIDQHGYLTERFPARWLSIKCLENDEQVLGLMQANGPVGKTLFEQAERARGELRERYDDEPANLLSDGRYGFIAQICRGVIQREQVSGRRTLSDKIDSVATHRLYGPLVMLVVVYALYWGVFTLADAPLLGWLGIDVSLVGAVEGFFAWLAGVAAVVLPEGLLQSLVVDGVIAGVGGVLGFVPLIMLMFIGVAMLEDSGYMARIAFIMDRILRSFGLHGSSVLALIVSGGIAGGCAVPGVMATRVLRDRRERFATILVCGLMNCGAKLPVYALLIAAFFEAWQAQVMFVVTLLSWSFALLSAWVLRKTVLAGPPAPFVMELPPYRLPTLRGLLLHMTERTWMYIRKAGTVILAVTIVLWALMTFPLLSEDRLAGLDANAAAEARLEHSLAGRLGRAMEPVLNPLGFEWRVNIALIGGFAAKEVIVSTMGVAYSMGAVDVEDETATMGLSQTLAASGAWTPLRAFALICFVMLYAPCMSTLAVIIKETRSWKWGLLAVTYPTVLAWMLAFSVYQGGRWLGLE